MYKSIRHVSRWQRGAAIGLKKKNRERERERERETSSLDRKFTMQINNSARSKEWTQRGGTGPI